MREPDLIFSTMAFFIGMVVHALVPVFHHIYYKIKYALVIVKKNNMYATYSYKVIEPWLEENYNQLYEVTHVGKKYVQMILVDRKSGYNQQELIITKEDLTNNYKRYEGKRSAKNRLRQRLNKS